MTWIKPTQPYLRRGDPLNQGVVGCWPMSEGCGPDTRDISGRGNHATLVNGPTRVMTEMGRALSFDGIDDWGTCGQVLNPDKSLPVTFTAWTKTYTSISNSRTIVGTQTSQLQIGWYHATNNRLLFGVNGGGGWWLGFDGPNYSVNTWYHVTGVYDGSNASLYVNGKLVAGPTAQTIGNNHAVSLLGRWSLTGTEWMNGEIGPVAIYSRVLAPAEIRRLAGLDGDPFEQWRPEPRRRVYAMRRWIDRSYPRGVLRGVQQGVA